MNATAINKGIDDVSPIEPMSRALLLRMIASLSGRNIVVGAPKEIQTACAMEVNAPHSTRFLELCTEIMPRFGINDMAFLLGATLANIKSYRVKEKSDPRDLSFRAPVKSLYINLYCDISHRGEEALIEAFSRSLIEVEARATLKEEKTQQLKRWYENDMEIRGMIKGHIKPSTLVPGRGKRWK